MPPRFNPTREVADLEVALSQAATPEEAWERLLAWRRKMDIAARAAACSLRTWDAGLARLVGLEHGCVADAIENPFWTQSQSDIVSKSALQLLSTELSFDIMGKATFALREMATAGAITNESFVTQALLAMLNGKPNLTDRQFRAILILLKIPDLSEDAYEHVFSCVRRAGRLGSGDLVELPGHPRASAAHWTLWYASVLANRDSYVDAMVLLYASEWEATRRDPGKRELFLDQLRQSRIHSPNGAAIFSNFVTDNGISLTDEELESLYVQCGGAHLVETIRTIRPAALKGLSPEAYAYLVRKEPEHAAEFRTELQEMPVVPQGGQSR